MAEVSPIPKVPGFNDRQLLSTPQPVSDFKTTGSPGAIVREDSDSEGYEDSPEIERPLILRDIDLEILAGSCVAVIGKVGSGKSSLFSAIIGEMYAVRGSEVTVAGSMAYVSQKPWITSSTIKDVILFGKEYNHERFEACLEYSGLKSDLQEILGGANALLGEQGINLSGGQKTRLTLARAMYADAEIYLLDDPL